MSIPLTLYDYLALLVPGTLILIGLAPAIDIGASELRPTGVVEIAVAVVIAFVLGHFNQWLTKAILVAEAQFIPFFNNTGCYLLKYPYPSPPPTGSPSVWKRLLGAAKALTPFYWSMQRFSKERASRTLAALNDYYGYAVRPEEAMGKALAALNQAGHKDVLQKREQFQTQADFLRGTATSLVIFALCEWAWGLPDFLAPHGIYGRPRLYLALFMVLIACTFVKRYLQFEFNAASMVFSTLEAVARAPVQKAVGDVATAKQR